MAQRKLSNKAASAALAILSLGVPSSLCAATDENTAPPAPGILPVEHALPDEACGRLEAARRAFRMRLPETPRLLEVFLDDFPASDLVFDAELMLADWYFYSREYPLALSCYSRIPDNAFSGDVKEDMLYRKAFSLLKSGYYDEAMRYFRRLARSGKYGDASAFYIAYIDYVNGRYDEAYERFSRIKKSGPKGAEAEFYLNQMDFRKGDYRKVANTTERLLTGTPVPDELLAESIRVGALSYFKLGDKTTAKNMLSRYADLTGDGAEISALYALATIYYDEGDTEKALPLFSTVTDYPGAPAQSSWLYIGQIYTGRGDDQAAALAFDKAARESWDSDVAETAAYNLAVTSASGMSLPFADAAAAMENFIDTYPASPYASSLSSYLANAYYGRRDYDKALRQIEKVSVRDEATDAMRQKILYQLGASLLQQGDTGQAVRYLTEAADGRNREVAAQAALWLGDAYYARKEYSRAVREYEKAVSSRLLGDNTALANYNLGYACLKTRDYARAEGAFRNAVDMPGLPAALKADARLRFADCLYYNGKYERALSIFRDISLDGGPDAVFAKIREADILGKDGQVDRKISILEALADSPDAGIWRSTVLSRLGDAYSEKGNDRRAAELYARMLDSGSADNSQTYYSLATNAENLYNSGDREAAYSAYRRLESSGIEALYPVAVTGIMRTASSAAETAEYAAKAAALPGLSAEEMNEAILLGAEASLSLGAAPRAGALASLRSLARSSDRTAGARAAVILGEQLLADGDNAGAEEILLYLVDNGSDDNYWLARGYIALSDVYAAEGKDYLAKLYLQTLQGNYPGNEKDIMQMISSRLKKLER